MNTLKWQQLLALIIFSCSMQTAMAQSSNSSTIACGLKEDANGNYIVRAHYNDSAVLECNCHGLERPKIEWHLFRPATFLGGWDTARNKSIEPVNGNMVVDVLHRYEILPGGFLRIKQANSSVVERYVCVISNAVGKNHTIVHFRLDYTDWYSKHVFHSVFWGALLMSVIVCAITFVINIFWILMRESILWWIQRAERLSRVRKMVEALEKYRCRQMERIHENYTKKIQIVRDNYHQQIETIRISYTAQSERFRDYRTAQMESMHSHLDSIRDNYHQQLQRVREHGARRAEQLWDSYEKQVNRMRAFSTQQRLKLMNQYKVKQRYLNKLFESFQDANNPEALRHHEEEVRAALELPDPLEIANSNSHHDDEIHDENEEEHHPLARSSSFHSLPEYIVDEDGTIRPSGLVSGGNATDGRTRAIRFQRTGNRPRHDSASISSDYDKPSTSRQQSHH